ncbi:hypothetical protein MLD38_004136 [Melastoma candidum]|uniref:Uncharacterized protein n=1 Tax=Melastoma candidum TaxID=119954 RepID=A0ACB9S7Y9_9MYRT|nr:hypothetical protein MLD38_004136 [Melastoma candidum]
MGNVNGSGGAGPDDGLVGGVDVNFDDPVRVNGVIAPCESRATPSSHVAGGAIPKEVFPGRILPPVLISPQMPIAPLQKSDIPVSLSLTRQSNSHDPEYPEHGIPVIVTWNYGGNDVLVEGSWDGWTSRKRMQRCGKDFSILLVLPVGLYHYKFIVDGEYRHVPELPHTSDESGRTCNLLDVHEYVPENPESIAELEAPPSPDSSYSQVPWAEGDFGKEPLVMPPQLHQTVLGPDDGEEPVPSRPQHVVLNHLFLEKGRSSQSVVALGLTHRFKSRYVTVVLYKPLKR